MAFPLCPTAVLCFQPASMRKSVPGMTWPLQLMGELAQDAHSLRGDP